LALTLVDTGPLVALFDPKDGDHARCRQTLAKLTGRLLTTVPVLTEAFHLLQPESIGSDNLRHFLAARGLSVWFLDDGSLIRALQLVDEYREHPMDLADASLVAAAEAHRSRKVFTLDKRDFRTYRARIGHRRAAFSIVP
jgi:predicted nucleic acid-binding protein